MSKEVKNYDCIDLVVGDGDDDLTAPLLAFAKLTTIVGVETPLLHYHQPSLLLKVNLINLVVTEIRVRWQIQFFIFPFKILTNQLCCWRRRSCVGVTTFRVGRETLLGCWREQIPGAFCCTFGK